MRIAQINPGHMNIPPDSWGAVEKIIWYYKLELEKLGHEVSIKYINEINQNDEKINFRTGPDAHSIDQFCANKYPQGAKFSGCDKFPERYQYYDIGR